jgi:hypothetical protein
MKQVHIPGDWAAPIAFALVAAVIFLRDIGVSDQYSMPAGNLIVGIFLVVAAFLAVAAVRGRSIQDSATVYYSDAKPTEFVFVAFGAGFLFLAVLGLAFAIQEKYLGGIILALIMSSGAFYLVYIIILKVHIVAFNTDKTFLTMKAKPWSLTRHYKASDFQSLSMGIQYDATSVRGLGATRMYCTYAVNGEKKVLLLRDGTIEEARETVKNITRLTGLKFVGEEPK